ncbi:MAG: DUF4132 domain-containing protein [Tannerellaceae bacterium]|jgi:hypothetical protein|nr:DUF4132 domain-containing protein [Tannerellaceae bacterium]
MKDADPDFNIRKVFPLLQTPLLNKLIGSALPSAYLIFEKLDALAARHAGYEYTSAMGQLCRLGDTCAEVEGAERLTRRLDRYPLPDVWREFYRNEIKDFSTMLQLLFALATHWGEGRSYKVYEFMNKEFLPEIKKFYGFDLHGLKKALSKLAHFNVINAVMPLLGDEYWDDAYAGHVSTNILASFFPLLDKGNARKEFVHETYAKAERRTVFLHQHSAIHYWMSEAFGRKRTKEAFADYFRLRYPFYRKSDYLAPRPPAAILKSPLSVFDFARACELGLIDEAELREELQARANAGESLRLASAFATGRLRPWQRNRLEAYGQTDFALLSGMVQKVRSDILAGELLRPEATAGYSPLALRLECIEGAAAWVDILRAYGSEPFAKTDHIYGSSYTRREILSRLLHICHPAATDTAATLAPLIKGAAGLSDERLVEAAIYSPQWLGIVEAYTGWKGLMSMACFFHAHINDTTDGRMKALIARFTPIDAEDLQAGAFDADWFRRASREAGAKRFGRILQAVGRITSASGYARISRYMDALNGKLDAQEVKKQVEEKRSRELLMIYGLIPLSRRSAGDLVERYRYFLHFLDQSRSFGSQRQESEKKAVRLGLMNLARNAGYSSVTRLAWHVETLTQKDIAHCFVPREISGVRVCMRVDASGRPGIHYFKQGKELVNTPGRLRKDPCVVGLRSICKHLRSAYAHSEVMLEQAMEEHEAFMASELDAFMKNPFIRPSLERLVFIIADGGGRATGFYTDGGLESAEGDVTPLEPSTRVRIAHPADLHALGVARLYEIYFYDNALVQPFEQVFRSFHSPADASAEEGGPGAGTVFYGEAANLFSSRGWISIDEERWQKVYHSDNVAVMVETRSHALSPADTGPCVMESLTCFDTLNGAPLAASDIPGHIYSETMRDLSAASCGASAHK